MYFIYRQKAVWFVSEYVNVGLVNTAEATEINATKVGLNAPQDCIWIVKALVVPADGSLHEGHKQLRKKFVQADDELQFAALVKSLL